MVPNQPPPSAIISSDASHDLFKFRDNLLLEQEAMVLYKKDNDQSALDEAIAAWENIFHQSEFSDAPVYFRALALSNGGHRYLQRYYNQRSLDDLNRAIELWLAAADLSSSDAPDDELLFQTQLAVGFYLLYEQTNTLTNLEQAISTYQKVLKIMPEDSPERAHTLYLLGLLFHNRCMLTGKLTDLNQSLLYYREAIKLTPSDSPRHLLYLIYQGRALLERYIRTEEVADLKQAVRNYYQAATTLVPPDSSDRAFYIRSLAFGLQSLYRLTKSSTFLEQAIQYSREAVTLSHSDPLERIGVLRALGTMLYANYQRTHLLDDLNQAIHAYEEALPQLSSASSRRAGALSSLGSMLHDRYLFHTRLLTDLEQALALWEESWSLLQHMFIALPVAYKLGQQRRYDDLPGHLMFAHIEVATTSRPKSLNARRRALEVAEGSKSRLLTELVGRGSLYVPSTISPEMAAAEQRLLSALIDLDTVELANYDSVSNLQDGISMLAQPGSSSRQTELERANFRLHTLQDLEQIWETIAHLGPEEADYVAIRRGETLTWTQLKQLAAELGQETVVLSFFMISHGTFLFLLRAGWKVPRIGIAPELNQEQWHDILNRFSHEVSGSAGRNLHSETWDEPLKIFLKQATYDLKGAERLVIVPMGPGHVVPWSVLIKRLGWCQSNGSSLSVITQPALGLLSRLRKRPSLGRKRALIVGNPHGNLPFAEQEAKEIATRFNASPLIGHQATRAEVLASLTKADVIHLATHASFIPGAPLDASIELVDGPLTAREIVTRRLQAQLLVLSACETGISEALGGEELAGLAQAFLQAGVRSLLVSLWKVNDLATATLMTAFYDAWNAGADKAQALQQAMQEVQEQPQWKHPYYWGGFVLLGDW